MYVIDFCFGENRLVTLSTGSVPVVLLEYFAFNVKCNDCTLCLFYLTYYCTIIRVRSRTLLLYDVIFQFSDVQRSTYTCKMRVVSGRQPDFLGSNILSLMILNML